MYERTLSARIEIATHVRRARAAPAPSPLPPRLEDE